jgi:hypothetical protein
VAGDAEKQACERKRAGGIVSVSRSGPRFRTLTQVLYEISAGSQAGPVAQRPIGLDYNYTMLLGAVAQLGERLICIQEVAGSIPTSSTRWERVLVFLAPGAWRAAPL